MLVGLDFDNTIVNYDQLLHRLATERGLIPIGLPPTKQAVRDSLRALGRESDWTELQGFAYGPRITGAQPHKGVKRFLSRCRRQNVQVTIISHKTLRPYRGESFDLHAAAHAFLHAHGFYEATRTGITESNVFLEPTLFDKLTRIGSLGCAAFVDDLPELLGEPAFPCGVRKVLFDPGRRHGECADYLRVESWHACAELLLAKAEAYT